VQFVADDLHGFIDWYSIEKTDTVKANGSTRRLEVNRLRKLYEVARIPDEAFRCPSKGLRKPAKAMGTNRTPRSPHRNVRFMGRGKTVEILIILAMLADTVSGERGDIQVANSERVAGLYKSH
jgi:hypothetical protein